MISHFLAAFSQIKLYIWGQFFSTMNKHASKSIPYTYWIIVINTPPCPLTHHLRFHLNKKFSPSPTRLSYSYKDLSLVPLHSEENPLDSEENPLHSFANVPLPEKNPKHKIGLSDKLIWDQLEVSADNR